MQAATSHLSPYSGAWYPGDAAELRALVTRLFADSERRTGRYSAPDAAGFVVPHAGLIYSGTVASAVYRQLRSIAPRRIVLLGFTHRGAARGAWIPDVGAFRTPLGDIEVDGEFAEALIETGAFGRFPEHLLCDHSVEIQLPLLQVAAPEARIVPVYVNRLDAEARRLAAHRLTSLVAPGTVLVASSDFTHYGRDFFYQPFPADELIGGRLRELDESAIEAAGTLDPEEFLRVLHSTGSTVCGYDPISLLLETLRCLGEREEIFQETLDYQTSGEITGDFRHSVSYAALGYFPFSALDLGPQDQRALLDSATRTLADYLRTGRRKPFPPDPASPALDRRGAAFVTLYSQGALRGCVGRRASEETLAQIVPLLTLSAALEDTRFDPVTPGESDLEIEISVLSPMKRIGSLEQFRVNQHGALLESGHDRALLLPQVAAERNWRADQFFEALARKAGVSREVYRDPAARLFVFRAQIIRRTAQEA
jgi:AmmeMemoRadiSam system protein B/AmmeMemoRadiSam system protein A